MPPRKDIVTENDASDRAVDGEEEFDETSEEEDNSYVEQGR